MANLFRYVGNWILHLFLGFIWIFLFGGTAAVEWFRGRPAWGEKNYF